LDDYIDQPCPAGSAGPSFDDNAPVEHCSHCNEQVYNLSALMPSEADQVLDSPEVQCIRFAATDKGRPRYATRPGSAAAAMLLGLGLVPQTGCGLTEEAIQQVSDQAAPEAKTKTKTKAKTKAKPKPQWKGRRARTSKHKAKNNRSRSAASKSAGSVASAEEPCIVHED
jgi:hypothetical protein